VDFVNGLNARVPKSDLPPALLPTGDQLSPEQTTARFRALQQGVVVRHSLRIDENPPATIDLGQSADDPGRAFSRSLFLGGILVGLIALGVIFATDKRPTRRARLSKANYN
jgi:hypothetical protein